MHPRLGTLSGAITLHAAHKCTIKVRVTSMDGSSSTLAQSTIHTRNLPLGYPARTIIRMARPRPYPYRPNLKI